VGCFPGGFSDQIPVGSPGRGRPLPEQGLLRALRRRLLGFSPDFRKEVAERLRRLALGHLPPPSRFGLHERLEEGAVKELDDPPEDDYQEDRDLDDAVDIPVHLRGRLRAGS
jgi:hypothetical protein